MVPLHVDFKNRSILETFCENLRRPRLVEAASLSPSLLWFPHEKESRSVRCAVSEVVSCRANFLNLPMLDLHLGSMIEASGSLSALEFLRDLGRILEVFRDTGIVSNASLSRTMEFIYQNRRGPPQQPPPNQQINPIGELRTESPTSLDMGMLDRLDEELDDAFLRNLLIP